MQLLAQWNNIENFGLSGKSLLFVLYYIAFNYREIFDTPLQHVCITLLGTYINKIALVKS